MLEWDVQPGFRGVFSVLCGLALLFLLIGIQIQYHVKDGILIFGLVSIVLSAVSVVLFKRAVIELPKNTEEFGDPKQKDITNMIKKLLEKNLDKFPLIVTVNAAIYAVIAGFAIKTTLENVFHPINVEIGTTESIASLQEILSAILIHEFQISVGVGLLITSIPFYHGAMIFLSEKSKVVLSNSSTKPMILHFSMLFLQAIIFLASALVVEHFKFVIAGLIALMVIDSLWILLARLGAGKPPPIGWLGLNVGFTSALIITLYDAWAVMNYDSVVSLGQIFLIICLGRTIADYTLFDFMYKK